MTSDLIRFRFYGKNTNGHEFKRQYNIIQIWKSRNRITDKNAENKKQITGNQDIIRITRNIKRVSTIFIT